MSKHETKLGRVNQVVHVSDDIKLLIPESVWTQCTSAALTELVDSFNAYGRARYSQGRLFLEAEKANGWDLGSSSWDDTMQIIATMGSIIGFVTLAIYLIVRVL